MAPAGSWESLTAALAAGADALYFGVAGLNMRSRSSNPFTLRDLHKIVRLTRERGVKTYLTLNTIIYDSDLGRMRRIVDAAAEAGVSAIIAADQAAILYAHQRGVGVHISTQLNVSNVEMVRFYAQWADVMVLARELSVEQIARIHRAIQRERICGPGGKLIKIELFAHGALCMAVSGRCYLSLHQSGCSANRGACRQICRRSWELCDRDTGEAMAIEGHYLLSPKDLCTIGFLDRLLKAGVRVLKIEGRARSAEYVGRTVECYREAVEAIAASSYTPERVADWEERLKEVFNRGFWGGYYLDKPAVELSPAYGSAATTRKEYVGRVTNFFRRIGVAEITPEASTLAAGDRYVILGATTGALEGTAEEIRVDLKPVEVAQKGVPCSIGVAQPVRRGDKLYKIVEV